MQNETLAEALTRFCPVPADVLLVGKAAEDLAESLETEGYFVLRGEFSGREAIAQGIVVSELDASSTSALALHLDGLRTLLCDGGALLIFGELAWGESRPEGSIPAADLVALLYERGFSVLERQVQGAGAAASDVPPLYRDGPVRRELLAARREPYRVRGYGPGDETAVLDLFHEAFFHDRRSLAHWLWKYHDHPDGGPFLSLAVDGDDRIGAHYAGYPVRFHDHEDGQARSFRAFQIGDTMTAKWAQGVGGRKTSLLARATQHFFNRHCAHRIGFNFGFNTGKIHRFYMRIVPGSEYLEAVTERSAEVGALRIGSPGWWQTHVAGLEVTRTTRVDVAWDEFFEKVAPAYGLLAERDAKHLHWRYLDHPDRDYLVLAVRRRGRLVGWGVFRREQDKLVWGDALFDPHHVLDARYLLQAALEAPEAEGVTRIEGWFPERPGFWDRLLGELGFESRPERRDLALIFMEFEERGLLERFGRRLYYTLAESDLF
jgi:hypothetical protein